MSVISVAITDATGRAPDDGSYSGLKSSFGRALQRGGGWKQALGALAALYLFISAINLMGGGLKSIAEEPIGERYMHQLYTSATENPLAGLCVGILLTSIVQSSSFTTSFTVGLVAAGQISLTRAIPIIMGANVGTSVTNILVSLAHIRRRLEFRRSLAGAIVHDLFNVLSVLLIMPLELAFGVLSRPASALAGWLSTATFFTENPKKFNFVKTAVEPIIGGTKWLIEDVIGLGAVSGGIVQVIVAIILLFAGLTLMVKMLRGLMKDRLSGLFNRTLFRSPTISFLVGIILTASVQSSSVTTSLAVPLVGSGVLSIRQIYPYTLGANIGTTVTALLAALAMAALAAGGDPALQTAAAGALGLAFAHLLFNIYGTSVFLPLQRIPIALAKGYARIAARRRILAGVYILIVFFVLPIVIILLVNIL